MMTAAVVLAATCRRGIILTSAGGRLLFDAPEGALTPDLHAALVECKPELIALLRQDRFASPDDVRDVESPRMLADGILDDRSPCPVALSPYNCCVSIREYWEERAAIREFDGGMDRPDAERKAWHDTLRWLRTVETNERRGVRSEGTKENDIEIHQSIREVDRRRERESMAAKTEEVGSSGDDRWEVIEGDCVEVMGSMAPGSARLVFADPPYNIGVDYGDGSRADRLPDRQFLDWCGAWIGAAVRLLAPDGSMWVLINHEWAARIEILMVDSGLVMRQWITWFESFGVNCTRKCNRTSRRLLHAVRDPRRHVFNRDAVSRPSDRLAIYNDKRANPDGKLWDDVWGINPPIPRVAGTHAERIREFPTQLPLGLLLPIVGCASNPGDLVLDPFSGSATTGAACLQLGRRYLGIEKSSTYAKNSRMRLGAANGSIGK